MLCHLKMSIGPKNIQMSQNIPLLVCFVQLFEGGVRFAKLHYWAISCLLVGPLIVMLAVSISGLKHEQ